MLPVKVDKPYKVKGQLFFSLFHFVIFIDFVILFLCLYLLLCSKFQHDWFSIFITFLFVVSIFLEMMSLLK